MGDTIRARGEHLTWRQVEREVVILDLLSDRYLALNSSAARLWPLVVAGASRRQLVDELVVAYGIDAASAASDVDRLVAQLADADLLEPTGDATADVR